jgi:hypothetical protein
MPLGSLPLNESIATIRLTVYRGVDVLFSKIRFGRAEMFFRRFFFQQKRKIPQVRILLTFELPSIFFGGGEKGKEKRKKGGRKGGDFLFYFISSSCL